MLNRKRKRVSYRVICQSSAGAAVSCTEAITGRTSVEIIPREREVSGFAAVAEFSGDVRLAEAVALAVVGRHDPAGVAWTRHAVGKLLIAGRALIAHVARIAGLALAGTCYLEHNRCLWTD